MPVDRVARSAEEHLDRGLGDSFPAGDPISVTNPSGGPKAIVPQDDSFDARILAHAQKLWRDAGSPADEDHKDILDEARTLIAVEDNPKAGMPSNSDDSVRSDRSRGRLDRARRGSRERRRIPDADRSGWPDLFAMPGAGATR